MINKKWIFTLMTPEESAAVSGGNWLLSFNPTDYSFIMESLDGEILYKTNPPSGSEILRTLGLPVPTQQITEF
ncbi:hypothetical protein H5968_21715 [Sphaerospermopsis sp. LEGE 00249]|uniref:hypothetical protein n=1 Tax=Sphaerospermopsis sp. LEGE 00249 TaxID=1380707 RepID=UPI00164ED006|nr:hypothetical protein [Sphaerospermopsis sp. LEGE 00249]MBC5797695.1 hypothetical protein [Sphaerospermopsis sp. LEGE 00249]